MLNKQVHYQGPLPFFLTFMYLVPHLHFLSHLKLPPPFSFTEKNKYNLESLLLFKAIERVLKYGTFCQRLLSKSKVPDTHIFSIGTHFIRIELVQCLQRVGENIMGCLR